MEGVLGERSKRSTGDSGVSLPLGGTPLEDCSIGTGGAPPRLRSAPPQSSGLLLLALTMRYTTGVPRSIRGLPSSAAPLPAVLKPPPLKYSGEEYAAGLLLISCRAGGVPGAEAGFID